MSKAKQEQHILLIEDNSKFYSIRLDAKQYSLGRHEANSIALSDNTISRVHACIIQRPIPDTMLYSYEIIDGNMSGKVSTNGLFINNKRCRRHTLKRGDVIRLGAHVKISYFLVHMSIEELSALFPIDDPSQPHLQPQKVGAFETLVDDGGMRTEFLSTLNKMAGLAV